LDIFLTQRFQYTLEEDADSITVRLFQALSRLGYKGSIQAENGFRLGHPWKLPPGSWADSHLAYLSGSIDALPPLRIPPTEAGGEPLYKHRALVDIRIRPNLFIVVVTYLVSVLLVLDLLGIELFWRSNYLLRLGLLFLTEAVLVWVTYKVTAQLKKRFELALSPSPQDIPL
jgi:hypothetical protein